MRHPRRPQRNRTCATLSLSVYSLRTDCCIAHTFIYPYIHVCTRTSLPCVPMGSTLSRTSPAACRCALSLTSFKTPVYNAQCVITHCTCSHSRIRVPPSLSRSPTLSPCVVQLLSSVRCVYMLISLDFVRRNPACAVRFSNIPKDRSPAHNYMETSL